MTRFSLRIDALLALAAVPIGFACAVVLQAFRTPPSVVWVYPWYGIDTSPRGQSPGIDARMCHAPDGARVTSVLPTSGGGLGVWEVGGCARAPAPLAEYMWPRTRLLCVWELRWVDGLQSGADAKSWRAARPVPLTR